MFLDAFANQTTLIGMMQVINSESNNVLGTIMFVSIFAIVLIISLRTTEPTQALIISSLIGLFSALGLYYLQILSGWWIALMILLFIGILFYAHFND